VPSDWIRHHLAAELLRRRGSQAAANLLTNAKVSAVIVLTVMTGVWNVAAYRSQCRNAALFIELLFNWRIVGIS
jgi:hypothetical protein